MSDFADDFDSFDLRDHPAYAEAMLEGADLARKRDRENPRLGDDRSAVARENAESGLKVPEWRGVYPGHCINPETCRGKSHCPRDYSCVE